MATLRQYDNGRWQAIVRRTGHPMVSKVFASKADAERWSRLTESELDRGVFIDRTEAERTTIADLIDRYIVEVTPQKRSARKEKQRLCFLKDRLGKLSPARLTSKHVAAFRDVRLREGRAGATVVKELNSLSHLIDTACKEWGIPMLANPVKLVRRPAVARGRDRRLTHAEYDALLAACRSSGAMQLEAIVVLAIETGMRLGELLGLEWSRVDLGSRVATLDLTKNGEARQVPLSSRAIDTLRSVPRNLNNPRVFWRWSRPDSFENAWRRVVLKARLSNLRFHDLRHEATSRLFEKGLGMMEVASVTGHKTLQMLKRYTHLKAEDLVARLG